MTSDFFFHRKIDKFAQSLDDAADAPPRRRSRHARTSASDDELAPLIAVSRRLSAVGELASSVIEPDPNFRAGLRAALLATAQRDGIGTTTAPDEAVPPLRTARPTTGYHGDRPTLATRHGRTRGAIIIGLAAGTLAISGISAASGDAVPGDPLYSIKRSTEKAQLAFADSDVGRGQLYLGFARARLTEARAVHLSPTGLSALLADLDTETRLGVSLLARTAADSDDVAPLDLIDMFVDNQRGGLNNLLNGLDSASRNRVSASLTLLEDVRSRSSQLRPTLSCARRSTSELDALGPLPSRCLDHGESIGRPDNSAHPSTPEPRASVSQLLPGQGRILPASDDDVRSLQPSSPTAPTHTPPPSAYGSPTSVPALPAPSPTANRPSSRHSIRLAPSDLASFLLALFADCGVRLMS